MTLLRVAVWCGTVGCVLGAVVALTPLPFWGGLAIGVLIAAMIGASE